MRQLTRTAAPATALWPIKDVLDALRVAPGDDDAAVGRAAAMAEALLDGEAGQLGRALITQGWRLDLSAEGVAALATRPPRGARFAVPLALPPVQRIDAVRLLTAAGTVTLGPTDYRLAIGERPVLEIVSAEAVPSRDDGLQIDFTAGYGDTPADVPEQIRQCGLMLAGLFYDHRGVLPGGGDHLPAWFHSMLSPFTVGAYGGGAP